MITSAQRKYFIEELQVCARLLYNSSPNDRLFLLAKIQHYTNVLLADAVEQEQNTEIGWIRIKFLTGLFVFSDLIVQFCKVL